MTACWLGISAGIVIGVLLSGAAIAAVLLWAWLHGKAEPEWPAPGDW